MMKLWSLFLVNKSIYNHQDMESMLKTLLSVLLGYMIVQLIDSQRASVYFIRV